MRHSAPNAARPYGHAQAAPTTHTRTRLAIRAPIRVAGRAPNVEWAWIFSARAAPFKPDVLGFKPRWADSPRRETLPENTTKVGTRIWRWR